MPSNQSKDAKLDGVVAKGSNEECSGPKIEKRVSFVADAGSV